MRFIHMADMHFDAPFTVLNTRSNLGEKRRLEQREVFKKVITYIKENNIEYLFVSGDLYEHKYIRETTIRYINSLFDEIPNTKIYITPGNHDPYLLNSMYKYFNWSKNVKIFNSNVEIVENEDVNIYGIGFNDFYFKDSKIEEIEIKDRSKINILITHGSLEGGSGDNREYNPLNKKRLEQLGFDYIALGHIHKPDYNSEECQRIVYPGSTIALGFDELGKHGIIEGEITKEKINIKFLPMDKNEFKVIETDITEVYSFEELIEKINSIELKDNVMYKIILTGKRNFEINIYNLYKYISNENIIKIKDITQINIDIDKISQEASLKGIFLKEVLNDKEFGKIDKNVSDKIIEIGLDVLK